ncbi:hypothetical protein SAMN05216376_105192 [Mameliella alba]|uniref:hypothetical protein n=1 Tax=Mameliella alba TaxID=561184 RepID=UPI000884EB5D|nr:hypothetical protein [Mameliella alba]OWV48242.1 hypothetical protein CDZ96_10520 [Mameliella alba]PTR40283.1 hypothetical protein LX94_01765 [Mameliella alba]GGF43720.1 hypothetical protein GCM10011319_01920 [Mameliella alba]SDC98093.1 hypothetical protein SAMN05216376_105192 [Mameliella alba]
MIKVRVIKPEGAALRGPCKVKLTKEQWERRVSVLGPVPKRLKAVDLDGGQRLMFKRGEVIEVADFKGRLSPALFEEVNPEPGAETGTEPATVPDPATGSVQQPPDAPTTEQDDSAGGDPQAGPPA